MLQDRERNFDEFIKITAGGVDIADYDQVQAALVKRYKEVYGTDIDLANTTADGIFVNDLALIINNILQSFKVCYANLDVETANGTYLDTLCKLSNVTRLGRSQSTAQLQLTAIQDTTLETGTIFVDNIGNEWTYDGESIEILASNSKATSVTVTCTEYGPVKAPAGSITQTLEVTYLQVTQESDANVGRNDETDAHLRARRAQSTGATGTTVLGSIVGALLAVDGIEDVQIINNQHNESKTADDKTSIGAHSIYAILRYSDSISVDDTAIAKILYNKLTPGISTSAFTDTSVCGEAKNYDVVLSEDIADLKQTINWKKATPIAPQLTVKISTNQFYATSTTTQIKDAVINYLNNLKLSSIPTKNDLIIAATYAGDTFKAQPTYVVTDVTLPSFTAWNTDNKNPNTYFKYTSMTDTTSDGVITMIFS